MFDHQGSETEIQKLEDQHFERTSPGDAVSRDFEPSQVKASLDGEGLPTFQTQSQRLVAPLHPDTFVCMADERSWVVRDQQAMIVVEFTPEETWESADGRRWVESEVAEDRLTQAGFPATDWEHVLRAMSELVAPDTKTATGWHVARRLKRLGVTAAVERGLVEVEPRRRPCRHYYRYMTDLKQDTEHQGIERLCTAQRDEQGLLFSVRDQRMQACQLRDPSEPMGRKILDEFDQKRMRQGLERVQAEQARFDVDQALADEEEHRE